MVYTDSCFSCFSYNETFGPKCNSFFYKIQDREKFLNKIMALFYGWGSTVLRLEPLQKSSLLFTTNFPEIPGTNFTNLRRMKEDGRASVAQI